MNTANEVATYKTVEHPIHCYISQDAFGAKYVSDANGQAVKDEEGFMMYVDIILG